MATYWGFLGLWQENRIIFRLFFPKSIKTTGIRGLIAIICSILEKKEENPKVSGAYAPRFKHPK
jgi:hypothetical protein